MEDRTLSKSVACPSCGWNGPILEDGWCSLCGFKLANWDVSPNPYRGHELVIDGEIWGDEDGPWAPTNEENQFSWIHLVLWYYGPTNPPPAFDRVYFDGESVRFKPFPVQPDGKYMDVEVHLDRKVPKGSRHEIVFGSERYVFKLRPLVAGHVTLTT